MKIKIGDLQVISAHTLVSYNSQPIQIEIAEEGVQMTVVFRFEDDDSTNREMRWTTENNKVVITLRNFNTLLGAQSPEPVRFGQVGERELLLLIRAAKLDQAGTRELYFCWLLGPEVQK